MFRCPGCDIEQSQWSALDGKGHLRDGEAYCCRDCAQQLGCICTPQQVDPELEGLSEINWHALRSRN